jgi:prepilin-type N-terminal cleavage/methylation domain-containing protein
MKKRRGFTLVELLVVMAIIAILATIVVPNVASYIRRGRATRALAEIKGIELALTKMMADADRGNLNHLFNPNGVRAAIGYEDQQIEQQQENEPFKCYMTADQFRAVQQLYTNTFYALLRQGRATLNDSYGGVNFADVLNSDVVKKLGVNYLELEFDPWGQMYQIFPGPWPSSRRLNSTDELRVNPNIHRRYILSEGQQGLPGTKRGGRNDGLDFEIYDADADMYITVSYPAPLDKTAFIYSTGANLISGQMVYRPYILGSDDLPYYDLDNPLNNFVSQEEALTGGGDDINNWDQGRSWERFYN